MCVILVGFGNFFSTSCFNSGAYVREASFSLLNAISLFLTPPTSLNSIPQTLLKSTSSLKPNLLSTVLPLIILNRLLTIYNVSLPANCSADFLPTALSTIPALSLPSEASVSSTTLPFSSNTSSP